MSSPFLPDWVLAHAERTPDAPAVDSPSANNARSRSWCVSAGMPA